MKEKQNMNNEDLNISLPQFDYIKSITLKNGLTINNTAFVMRENEQLKEYRLDDK